MFTALKSLFKANHRSHQDEQAKQRAERAQGLPIGVSPEDLLGLRLGGMVTLDLLRHTTQTELRFSCNWSDQANRIEAVGVVELGHGEQVIRFYLENDTWLQAHLRNGIAGEYKVFDFVETQHLSNKEMDDLINRGGNTWLGEQTFTLKSQPPEQPSDAHYQRIWGADTSEWSPPVVLEETVTSIDGSVRHVTHHCMMFERVAAPNTYEYVLLSAECDEADQSYCVVTNLGIDLNSLDISAY